MTRLEEKLSELSGKNRKGLFIYIMAGVPDEDTTVEAALSAERAGADVIELGMPFSDPLADGPVIQEAGILALKNGMTLEKILSTVKRIRQRSSIPLVGMGYINNIMNYGIDRFASDFKSAGMDAVIVPDVPHEESGELREVCEKTGLHLIEFVTPGTTAERVKETLKSASGFIYAVSANGVTGERDTDYSAIGRVIDAARKETDLPFAIGFGISSPDAARAASKYADAVIIGSAVVRRLMKGDLKDAEGFIASLRRAIDE